MGGDKSGEYEGWSNVVKIVSSRTATQLLYCGLQYCHGARKNCVTPTFLSKFAEFFHEQNHDTNIAKSLNCSTIVHKFFVNYLFAIEKNYEHCLNS